ncbi:MAG TPA: right-handed parallel beta-helix repeat-containing protein, partial [Candidatus Nanoarchaeia archaeon]|nr:right-handed parallel beta-helix repeat-containing protein [Candidatus Nanoarchaeia archaeon]
MIKKTFMAVITISLLLFSIAVGIHFSSAQSETQVSGIINQDTTWTKANSPYNFVGPVGILDGVTLTIQAGVIVNLNNYYLQVNGTLSAIGTSTNPIYINGGGLYGVYFTSSSVDCTIENSVINSTTTASIYIINASPNILNNVINGHIEVDIGGSPVVSNNTITGSLTVYGSPVISNNTIKIGPFSGTSCIITQGSATVSNNIIEGDGAGEGIWTGGNPIISNNTISNFATGIRAYYSSTIEDNLITNNYIGIDVGLGINLIQNNTIVYNYDGLNSPKNSSNIIYNNVQNNSNYNIHLDVYSASNVTAFYNWWGTNNITLANLTFNYMWNGFDIVTVSFIPLLTSPNLDAPAIPVSTPSPTPSITPAQTP